MLLTSPALQRLNSLLPGAHFTYLVGPWSADLARHGTMGEAVETLAFPGFARQPKANPLAPYRLLRHEARRLRQRGFDAAVVFRPDHWWGAFLARAAGIPIRVGHRHPDPRPLLTHAVPPMPHAHAAEQALALADLCAQALTSSLSSPSARDTSETRPQFTVTPAEREAAISFIQANDIGQRPLVAFHPSAGEPLKSWPLARWAALADRLAGEGIDVLLSGGPADEPLLQDFARRLHHPPSAVLLGQPIGVAAAVYERCAAVVGPDNGPLHLAAAVGAPTVRLYGPAPIAVFGPWPPGPRQRTLVAPALGCVPCGRLVDPPCRSKVEPPCMLLISVEEVAENVLSLVRASASGLASAAPG